MRSVDAVVIGAGHNGLVAANLLVDAGWDVLVLEATSRPGGAVQTAELAAPGFHSDVMSAFYPLGAGSPVMRELDLESHGLRGRHADVVFDHASGDGTCAALWRDVERTCASLDAFAPGDGDGWRALYERWERTGPALVESLFRPFPPVGPALRLLRAEWRLIDFLRFSLLPARRMGEEYFRGEGGRRLLVGAALHADLTPDAAAGGLYGWLLCGLAQQVGWPVPEGGAGELAAALLRRLADRGARVDCDSRVESVLVTGGRAVGVRTA